MLKRSLAVAWLVIALGSIALADGSGLPPTPKKPPQAKTVRIADGSGLPPATVPKPTKPPQYMAA
jgi:hypothetical protein